VVERLCRSEIRRCRDTIFLFEDTQFHPVMAGQAREARGEVNAVAIPVKRCPGRLEESFWSDQELPANRCAIDAALEVVEAVVRMGRQVVVPRDFGAGGELRRRAPLTAAYLNQRLEELRTLAGG
jgi:hypothetical protein